MVGLAPKWVRLDHKLDKCGTFSDQISVHLARWAKCTEIWSEKVPDLSNLGSNLTHFGAKPTIPATRFPCPLCKPLHVLFIWTQPTQRRVHVNRKLVSWLCSSTEILCLAACKVNEDTHVLGWPGLCFNNRLDRLTVRSIQQVSAPQFGNRSFIYRPLSATTR